MNLKLKILRNTLFISNPFFNIESGARSVLLQLQWHASPQCHKKEGERRTTLPSWPQGCIDQGSNSAGERGGWDAPGGSVSSRSDSGVLLHSHSFIEKRNSEGGYLVMSRGSLKNVMFCGFFFCVGLER